MTGAFKKDRMSGLFAALEEDVLREIADEVSAMLCRNPISRGILRKYAIRQEGAGHILASRPVKVDDPFEAGQASNPEDDHQPEKLTTPAVRQIYGDIDSQAVSHEILVFLVESLAKKEIPAAMAEAVRRMDIQGLKICIYQKCRSRFADGARNPRFRAIRSILSEAGKEGLLQYRPGRQLFSKSGAEFGTYAFSKDENLPVLAASELDRETFSDWSCPDYFWNSNHESDLLEAGFRLTQKRLVLELARFFWKEVVLRFGSCFVYLADLKRYLENTLPVWLGESILPDPAAALTLSLSPNDPADDCSAGRGKMDETSLYSGPAETHQAPPELRPLVSVLAREWFARINPQRARLFCLMYFCEFGATDAARRTGLGSPQSADYHYKAVQKDLALFCTTKEGLSPPDFDPELARKFFRILGDYCEKVVLPEGCR